MKAFITSLRRHRVLLIVLALIAVAGVNIAGEPLAQPLAWQPLEPGYFEYSGFSATGRIYEINRTTYNVSVISDKPFWAPKPRVINQIALWPANTLLVVHIAPIAPINIHGQRVEFRQLTVGQTIHVEYSIYLSAYGGYGCGARRIDG